MYYFSVFCIFSTPYILPSRFLRSLSEVSVETSLENRICREIEFPAKRSQTAGFDGFDCIQCWTAPRHLELREAESWKTTFQLHDQTRHGHICPMQGMASPVSPQCEMMWDAVFFWCCRSPVMTGHVHASQNSCTAKSYCSLVKILLSHRAKILEIFNL